MGETTIADFVARFLPDSSAGTDAHQGRVLLSQKRLLLAAGEGRVTVPLRDVFDVVVGHVPVGGAGFFDDTVAIAYTRGADRVTAIVEGDAETIDRFRIVLFKALLDGTTVRVTHPAKVGGRHIDQPTCPADLHLERQAVRFEGLDPPLRIELSDVTYFRKTERTIDGERRPALEVQFTADRRAVTSEMVLNSGRQMNLLGRYLRLEYSDLVAEMADIDLQDAEIEALTALYAGAGDGALDGLLGTEPEAASTIVDSLAEKRLVAITDEGARLTSLGRMAVSDRLEAGRA